MLQNERGFASWLCCAPPGLLLVPHLSFPAESSPHHHALLVIGWERALHPIGAKPQCMPVPPQLSLLATPLAKKGPQQPECPILQHSGLQETATILLLHQTPESPTRTPNIAPPSDLSPMAHWLPQSKRGGRKKKKSSFHCWQLSGDSTCLCPLQTQQNSAFIT